MKRKAPFAASVSKPKARGAQGKLATKQQKKQARKPRVVVRPWTAPQFEELSKEERDIVLDRLQKEVAEPAREHKALSAQVVCGVNHVAKCVARGDLRVVVFANNPDSLAFGHLPLLCRMHGVPICVLHLSSKALGKLFQLKSLVAVGLKALQFPDAASGASAAATDVVADALAASTPEQPKKEDDGAIEASATVKKVEPLLTAERAKFESISAFLVTKASKKTR